MNNQISDLKQSIKNLEAPSISTRLIEGTLIVNEMYSAHLLMLSESGTLEIGMVQVPITMYHNGNSWMYKDQNNITLRVVLDKLNVKYTLFPSNRSFEPESPDTTYIALSDALRYVIKECQDA